MKSKLERYHNAEFRLWSYVTSVSHYPFTEQLRDFKVREVTTKACQISGKVANMIHNMEQ